MWGGNARSESRRRPEISIEGTESETQCSESSFCRVQSLWDMRMAFESLLVKPNALEISFCTVPCQRGEMRNWKNQPEIFGTAHLGR